MQTGSDLTDEQLSLHREYGSAFFAAKPNAPGAAIVYEVDPGDPMSETVKLTAAVFGFNAAVIGTPITVAVGKTWLTEFWASETRGAARQRGG